MNSKKLFDVYKYINISSLINYFFHINILIANIYICSISLNAYLLNLSYFL